MISIQSRPDALCARSFLQLRTIFCRFAVLLDFRGFRCYSVTTRSGHLILCGAICGVLALFHLPAKYIAFFCAIFILLLACVSAKYLKGSRMQSVPSCTFSQNRAFVCFLSIVYCWFCGSSGRHFCIPGIRSLRSLFISFPVPYYQPY